MKSLVSLTQHIVGRKYALGIDDCFSAVIKYIEGCGVQIPDEYMGLTMDTYAEVFKSDPDRAKEIMVSFMEHLLPEIDTVKAFAGDILLLSLDGGLPFLAIHAGNGRVIAAAEGRGVCQLSINRYEIKRAWRCRRLSHLQ